MILNLLFLILSLAGGCGLWGALRFHPAWLLLIVPGCFLLCVILYMLFLTVTSLSFGKKDPEKSSAFCRFQIWLFLHWLMSLLRVRIRMRGEELLPDGPCVIVCNHRSVFDPMTLLSVLRRRKLIFISKEENFRIPIAGNYIRRAGFFAIDRENGIKALRTLKKAAERMQAERTDIGIYPEGTRSKNGDLLEFKTGAFYLAKKAEVPVVVMSAWGTEKIGKKLPLRRVPADLTFLGVIDAETVKTLSMEKLAERTRSMIEADLKTRS